VLPEDGRLFALNPPADPTGGDTDAEENQTGDAIAAAIRGAGLERVVALSTYGAQPGTRIGDLGTLYRFEQRLADLDTPVAVLRVAYLLSNWDGVLAPARDDGVLPAMLDERRPIPMVAPVDVGVVVADLLTRPEPATGLHFVEGPEPLLTGRCRPGVRGRPRSPRRRHRHSAGGLGACIPGDGPLARGGGVVRRDDGAHHQRRDRAPRVADPRLHDAPGLHRGAAAERLSGRSEARTSRPPRDHATRL